MSAKKERIRELRESGASLFDAQLIVKRQDLAQEVARAKSIDDIKPILYELVAALR